MRCFKGFILVLAILSLAACSKMAVKKEPAQTPNLSAVHSQYNEALQQLKQENYDVAITGFDLLISQEPQYPGPYVNKGIAYYKKGLVEEANTSFESVLALRKALNHEMSQADTSEQSARKTSALEAESASLTPFLLTAYNYLGLIARERGQFDEAEAHYRAALALDESHAASIRNLGILLDLYKGDLKQALALYEQYQDLQDEADPKVKDWIFDIKSRVE